MQNLNALFGAAYRERQRFSVPQLGYLGYRISDGERKAYFGDVADPALSQQEQTEQYLHPEASASRASCLTVFSTTYSLPLIQGRAPNFDSANICVNARTHSNRPLLSPSAPQEKK